MAAILLNTDIPLEHGLVLATGNTPHFAWVPGFTIVDWRQP